MAPNGSWPSGIVRVAANYVNVQLGYDIAQCANIDFFDPRPCADSARDYHDFSVNFRPIIAMQVV